MKKQDRQGVRTAQQLEQKYKLGGESGRGDADNISKITQELTQLKTETNLKLIQLEERIETISSFYPVGSVYISINNTDPTTIFGGTWEVMSQAYLVVGLDSEDDESTQLQFLDNCTIWKRTA